MFGLVNNFGSTSDTGKVNTELSVSSIKVYINSLFGLPFTPVPFPLIDSSISRREFERGLNFANETKKRGRSGKNERTERAESSEGALREGESKRLPLYI